MSECKQVQPFFKNVRTLVKLSGQITALISDFLVEIPFELSFDCITKEAYV
jgi:hypothetical protein